LNSLTKCTVEQHETTSKSGKKTKGLAVKVSSTRFLKRRKTKNKVAGLENLNTTGVDAKNNNSVTTTNLSFKGTSEVNKLKEKISKERLSQAVTFEEVDQIPLFTSCENKGKKKNLACFNNKMMEHIQNHFQYPHEAIINKIQGNVWVRFVIDEEGSISNLKVVGPQNGKLLKHEAERVIAKLTSFKPALKKQKKVIVKYGFPINFSLQE